MTPLPDRVARVGSGCWGGFLPVQEPPDDYEIVATVTPPGTAHETPQFDRE
jgi:hypothetical protein